MPVCGHLSAGSQSLHAIPVGGTVPETAGQEQGCQRLCGPLPRHNTGEVIGHRSCHKVAKALFPIRGIL